MPNTYKSGFVSRNWCINEVIGILHRNEKLYPGSVSQVGNETTDVYIVTNKGITCIESTEENGDSDEIWIGPNANTLLVVPDGGKRVASQTPSNDNVCLVCPCMDIYVLPVSLQHMRSEQTAALGHSVACSYHPQHMVVVKLPESDKLTQFSFREMVRKYGHNADTYLVHNQTKRSPPNAEKKARTAKEVAVVGGTPEDVMRAIFIPSKRWQVQ
eukprot:GHVU01003930.1.p1 GENE.GHVU01003930.1~~GHVU01003930.1.p1  ORF type:complete len:214 (+),score=13.22 GHVU01003930.1:487-1128(+)